MDEGKLVDGAVQALAGGSGLGFGGWIAYWLLRWSTGRVERREDAQVAERAQLDQGWKAYRETLEERLKAQDERLAAMESEIEACHQSKRETESALTTLRAYVEGQGQARQMGAAVAAADRLLDRDMARDRQS